MASVITSITGLQNLTGLTRFNADWNGLQSVNLSNLPNLQDVDISDCDIPGTNTPSLTSVNLSGSTAVTQLRLDDSDFSAGVPNISGLTSLELLDLDQCSISGVLDVSASTALSYIDVFGNAGLTSLIISDTQPITDLYAYECALTETAVDDILVVLSNNGQSGGFVDLRDGTNAIPSATGLAAKATLEGNGWTVDVNQAPPGSVGIAPSTDFDIVGDFTIEMFVNMNNLDGFPRPYSFGAYPAPNAMSIEGGQLYFWANGSNLINGAFAPTLGQWYHLCVMGSGSTAYMFIDGVEVASSPYGGSISSTGLPLTIGDGNEVNSAFNGLISNFRWTDSAVYSTSGFTVPTSPLTDLTDTILLIFQGNTLTAQLLDNSGSGNNATNDGAGYSANSPFVGVQGSLQMGNA